MEKHQIDLKLKIKNMEEAKEEINEYIKLLKKADELANRIANREFEISIAEDE